MKTPTKAIAKLEITDYNVELDYQLQDEDLNAAVDKIFKTQWSETTTLHTRYRHHHPMAHQGMVKLTDEMLFHFKGLSANAGGQILNYRAQVPRLVTMAQLYSVYTSAGPTFVDKQVELHQRQGHLRKFIITNASPVISRSLQKYQAGKITYGFENVEVVARAGDYYQLLDDVGFEVTRKLKTYLKTHPTAVFVGTSDFTPQEMDELVRLGFVTLSSNFLNEIESHQYSIAYPGCGTFVKLVNHGRVWVVKTLSKEKHDELLEERLWQKFEGAGMGDPKLTNFRKPFYGYDLWWILADALGAGVVEVFNTPVGRGWRLTGKV